ncbi:glycosyltransferase [Massilia norwichensis]|uniref:Glycosyltransferase n=1 Tax=Massilia norwichensis TaxID=1442366 RepID=A0ABT2A5E3_9BURK|nr:glycosyltransferase [Massilia norwichensis]
MTAIFVGSLFPEQLKQEIQDSSIGPIANANNALQHALVAGLSQYYPELKIVNLPQVGAYPARYRKLTVPQVKVAFNSRASGNSLSFLNLVGVKHFARYVQTRRALSGLLKASAGSVTVFIYDLHAPFMKAVAALKNKYKYVKVCVIVPDLPGFTDDKPSMLYGIYSRMTQDALKKSYDSVDAFVLLSKHMVERLPVGRKPWVVVEGIYDEGSRGQTTVPKESAIKTIFYSGSLDERNGVMRLLNAFQMIRREDYRLFICGDGDCKQAIETAAASDRRIVFKGQIPRDEVLGYQRAATLLVNPRTSKGEFTRYSFPSKTMEYLASGVPVLMHRLDGIPEEYYEYSYVPEDLSISALASEIERIVEQPSSQLQQKGASARDFILREKNAAIQCKKIGDMMAAVEKNQ